MDVVDRIFSILEKRSIEQKQFADAVGVAPSKVTQWKTKSSMSYLKRMSKIADFLGVSVDYLINGDEKNKPTTESGDGPSESELVFKSLPPAKQEEALRYMRYLAENGDK